MSVYDKPLSVVNKGDLGLECFGCYSREGPPVPATHLVLSKKDGLPNMKALFACFRHANECVSSSPQGFVQHIARIPEDWLHT